MKMLFVKKSSLGFSVYSEGLDDAVLGEDVFIALGRYFVYFPKFSGAFARLEKGVWKVRKRSGRWIAGRKKKRMMFLDLESESSAPVALDDLLYFLGIFLYTVRVQLGIDIRWIGKPVCSKGYGNVIPFPSQKRT